MDQVPFAVEIWGLVPFVEARERQLALVRRRANDEIGDVLVLCEHPPVVTLGRGADPADVLDRRFPVVEIERGGKATFHGPGQVVGYLIRKLREGERDLHAHLRLLEQIVIDASASFGVSSVRNPAATGVWVEVGERLKKLASIGVAAKSWVTFHGFAWNVAIAMDGFSSIKPCGFHAETMTSLEGILETPPSWRTAAAAAGSAASRLFA